MKFFNAELMFKTKLLFVIAGIAGIAELVPFLLVSHQAS
jgi:hypothetical protein